MHLEAGNFLSAMQYLMELRLQEMIQLLFIVSSVPLQSKPVGQCPQSTGLYSNGSLAGAIIASLFGGLVLGIASMWIMNIKAVQQFSQKAHGGWLVWKNGGRSEILD